MKGLVGLAIELSRLFHVWRGSCCNCETRLSFDCIVGGIRRYVEEIDIVCLKRALVACLERALVACLERALMVSLERALF